VTVLRARPPPAAAMSTPWGHDALCADVLGVVLIGLLEDHAGADERSDEHDRYGDRASPAARCRHRRAGERCWLLHPRASLPSGAPGRRRSPIRARRSISTVTTLRPCHAYEATSTSSSLGDTRRRSIDAGLPRARRDRSSQRQAK
jgi:hypothetical protein